jgi:hypothetical protein
MLALKRKRTRGSGSDYFSDESVLSGQALSDDEIDISSALTGKRAKITPVADESDHDLQQFIQESISKRDIKTGTEIVKKVKGKGKVAKGEVGGGSFQSMGQSTMQCCLVQKRLTPNDRSSSVAATVSDTSRLSNTNPNTASVHSSTSHKSPSGSCWHGSYWLRKISCVYDSSCTAAWRTPFNIFRCKSLDFTSNQRVSSSGSEGWKRTCARLEFGSRRSCGRQRDGRSTERPELEMESHRWWRRHGRAV